MSIAAGNLVVTTRQGQVRGQVTDGVAMFKGIPYAAPPFGSNRFQAPRPPEPWGGVRDAHEYGRVDLDELWKTAQRDAPHLVSTLEAIVAALPPPR